MFGGQRSSEPAIRDSELVKNGGELVTDRFFGDKPESASQFCSKASPEAAHLFNSKASWINCTARGASFCRATIERFNSEEPWAIIKMLMLAEPRTPNALAATPGAPLMPSPTSAMIAISDMLVIRSI